MSEEDADGAAPQPGLSATERGVAAIAAALLLLAGTWATFVSENEAGTVALLAIGGVMTFIAVTGAQIVRAKAGDWEIEFARRVMKELPELLDELPPDKARRLGRDLLWGAVPPEARSAGLAFQGAEFEVEVQAALQAYVDHAGGATRRGDQVFADGPRPDFLVANEAGEQIAVEAKLGLATPTRHALVNMANALANTGQVKGLVIVVRDGFTPEQVNRLAEESPLPTAVMSLEDVDSEGAFAQWRSKL